MNSSFAKLFLLSIVVAISVVAATNYDQNEATRAWYLCKLNSCIPEQISNGFSCPVCRDIEKLYGETLTDVNVFYHLKGMAHGYTAFSPQRNQIIVGFRGTRTVQWFYDFDFKFANLTGCPSTVEKCFVHQGFQEVWQILEPNITLHVSALLSKYEATRPNVVVVGHSLGAAVSTIAAYNLVWRLKAPVTHLINFGSPRVFTYFSSVFVGNLFKSSNVTVWRLVWMSDLVPKLPVLSMGFFHLPSEVWYPQNSTASYNLCHDGVGSEDLSPNCSFGAVPIQFANVQDHGSYMAIEHGCGAGGDN